MATLKAIRKRIQSVKSTQQITKAMKMVSAAKMKRATDAVTSARPYALKMGEMFQSLLARTDDREHPLLRGRDVVKKAVVVVLTTDRGLCGGFNGQLLRKVDRFVWERKELRSELEQVRVLVYGKKGRDYFRRRNFDLDRVETDLDAKRYFEYAQSLGRELTQRYLAGDFDEVYLAYNVFASALTQRPTIERIFPFTAEAAADVAEPEVLSTFVYEPDQAAILDALLPRYLDVKLFQAFLEHQAGEHGARMSAMDSASRNAREVINRLTLQYNRARQAAITKELVEIVSGAEAL
ncbi:ATP synthase F1 subunit gamma [Myxococcota bacterium]|nr:ATP synthase F1 subunit gamma [Myxococcota bacterium]